MQRFAYLRSYIPCEAQAILKMPFPKSVLVKSFILLIFKRIIAITTHQEANSVFNRHVHINGWILKAGQGKEIKDNWREKSTGTGTHLTLAYTKIRLMAKQTAPHCSFSHPPSKEGVQEKIWWGNQNQKQPKYSLAEIKISKLKDI